MLPLAILLSTAGRLGYLIYPRNLLLRRWLLLPAPDTTLEQEPASEPEPVSPADLLPTVTGHDCSGTRPAA